jgi:hypothetical protein
MPLALVRSARGATICEAILATPNWQNGQALKEPLAIQFSSFSVPVKIVKK